MCVQRFDREAVVAVLNRGTELNANSLAMQGERRLGGTSTRLKDSFGRKTGTLKASSPQYECPY